MRKDNSLSGATLRKIANFWKWFESNAETIRMADLEDNQEILLQIELKMNGISKRLYYELQSSLDDESKSKCIITAFGYPKKIPKVQAFETAFPKNFPWELITFLKPSDERKTLFNAIYYLKQNNGTDAHSTTKPYDNLTVYDSYLIHKNNIRFTISDYDFFKKKLFIKVYLSLPYMPKDNSLLKDVKMVLMHAISEQVCKRNIIISEIKVMPSHKAALMDISALEKYINILYVRRRL